MAQLDLADHGFVDRQSLIVAVDAQAAGGIGLRIDIDQQDVPALLRQTGAEIDGGRCLSNAALLAGNRDDSTHSLCRFAGADLMPTKMGLHSTDQTIGREQTSSEGASRQDRMFHVKRRRCPAVQLY